MEVFGFGESTCCLPGLVLNSFGSDNVVDPVSDSLSDTAFLCFESLEVTDVFDHLDVAWGQRLDVFDAECTEGVIFIISVRGLECLLLLHHLQSVLFVRLHVHSACISMYR